MAYGPPTTADPTNVMGRRIAAWFIDVIVPTVAAFILGYIVFLGAATKISGVPTDYCTFQPRATNSACIQVGDTAYVGTHDDARAAFTVGGLVFLVGALNLFVVQGLTGAAVGKHMLGLRVIRADGRIAGFGANAARTLLLIVDQFFCALVGLITASVTHPHRRVGDMAAGTYVVGKEAVGGPAAAIGPQYPPQSWTPPSPGTGWGPPPAGGTQTWGPPPAAQPWPQAAEPAAPASTAPPTWGTPGANPPPAETPSTWGMPAPAPLPEPVPEPTAATPPPTAAPPAETVAPSAAPEDAPGWASPTPTPAADPTPAPTAVQPTVAPAPQAAAPASTREPQWDSQRDAWVFWEAETSRWLQFDAATGQWGPLR